MTVSQRSGDPRTTPPDLDPIRIATDELELRGAVAPTGQRITDLLLRGQDLAFLPAGAEPLPEAWISIEPGDILFVVPPPLRPARDWRPQTATATVFTRVGAYAITGSAHLAPGTAVDRHLPTGQPFLPLTSASIADGGDSPPELVDVVIVNLSRATELRAG